MVKVVLNHSGIAEILQSTGMHRLVQEATETVAAAAEGSGVMVDNDRVEVPVIWDVDTTDRAHGIVTLAHASGRAVQAKHGLLNRAAAAAGLEVKSGKGRKS